MFLLSEKNNPRINRINSIMGKWYGLKYRIAYYFHQKHYIKCIDRKSIKIKLWEKYVLYLRLFSRDLDFFESIFIGCQCGEGVIGEYDIEGIVCEDILDLGANIGLFSVLYAIRYPKKRIIAVEPETNNYKQLLRNTQQFENVTCLQAGVWYRDHAVKVYPSRVKLHGENSYSDGAFYIGECEEKDPAASQVYSITSLADQYGLKHYLVKMDIEGAEYEIFEQGNLDWINQIPMLVMETHGWLLPDKGIDELVIETMSKAGFHMTTQGENKIFRK